MNLGVALKVGLSITFTLILILFANQFVTAISFQKINLPDKTVRLQSLNNPIIDIQLLENTDQCLVDCYSVLKIHAHQPFSISQSDSIQFLKSNPERKGISSYSFELLETIPYDVTIPIYKEISYQCDKSPDNNSIVLGTCTRLEQAGSRIETRYIQSWKPIDFFSFSFELGKDYIIRLSGKKSPSLGENNIDWLLTLKGIPLTEFAWWNSSWQYRKLITITNNNNSAVLPVGYSINLTFNHSGLVQMGKSLANGNDIRIIYNDSIELDRLNTTKFNSSNAVIWFSLQKNISASNLDNTNYYVYYGNPQSTNPPNNGSRIFLFYEDFEDGDVSDWLVYKGSNVILSVNTNNPFQGNYTLKTTDTVVATIDEFYKTGDFLASDYMIAYDGYVYHALPAAQQEDGAIRLTLANQSNNTLFVAGIWDLGNEFQTSCSSPPQNIVNNTWYHVRVILNGTNIASYLFDSNEILLKSSTCPQNATSFWGGTLKFGLSSYSGDDDSRHDFLMGRKYLPPEPTANVGLEESIKGSLHMTDLIPIQVVKDVDLVLGKRTLVRTVFTYLNGTNSSQQTATVENIYLNGIEQNVSGNKLLILKPGSDNFIDLFFQPQDVGQSIPISAEVSSSVGGFNKTNVTKLVNVTRTRELNLSFVSVDGPQDFEKTALDNMEFLNKIYPLKDNGINFVLNRTDFKSHPFERNALLVFSLLSRIHKSTLISGQLPERSVGIVPYNWFANNMGMPGTRGYSKGILSQAVLIEEDFGNLYQILNHASAHELGHTYGLCDEYDNFTWFIQNGLLLNLCPNGDNNPPFEELDNICSSSGGCPTSSVEPITKQADNITLFNVMGNSANTSNAWITKESFNYLLNQFKHSSPEFASSRIVVSGIINKTSNISRFENFYTLDVGQVINKSEFITGNFSIEVFNNTDLIYNISFDVSFINIFFGGNTTETNHSSFAFTIPFSQNITRFVLKENNITKDVRNITNNKPQINIISQIGGKTFSNEIMNISWIGSDLDGDNISYAVLFLSLIHI